MEFFDRRAAKILLTILAFALGLALVYVARAVLIVFAFSILFAYLIDPIVRFLQRHSLFFKNLRGPHVVEAYLVFLAAIFLLAYSLAPQFHRNAGQLMNSLPSLADRVSSGQIATDLGSNLGWTNTQSDRVKTFLQGHRAMIEDFLQQTGRLASSLAAGILVIPILAIFFLSDGGNLANHAIRLLSTEENHPALRTLAEQLHRMLQHYIRAKVTLGGLSFLYCCLAMFALGFPHPVALGVLAGMLEFIPVVGWMTAAATILTAGALAHAHWIWMLALLGLWRILMDYWIAPRVMGRELEMHPLLAIFTLMIGGAVGGIIGIYLSVPLAATLRVVYRNLASLRRLGPPLDAPTENLTLTSRL